MTDKKLYLSDEPIERIEDDRFHHNIYADLLFKIIKDVDSPWNIGLFGRWGSGKTSIIKMLIKKIDEENNEGASGEKIAYIEFDAWKYAGDSLREQILLKLNNEFKICKEDEIKDRLFCVIETEKEINKPENDTSDEKGIKDKINNKINKIKQVYHSAPVFFSLTVILVIFSIFGGFLLKLNTLYFNILNVLVPGALIPLLFELIKKVDSATVSIARKQILPIREAPAQFEEIFKYIINNIKINKDKTKKEAEAKKVIIIIDNLDRCPSKTVIEMLSMIKTFMNINKCIYILPCDDEALRKHLKTVKGEEYSEADAQEFLRKFFQTTIKIPPFLKYDIESFASNLNSELKYPFKKSVIDVIISAYIKNPRRIKHALNKLTTLTLIAKEKEEKKIIQKGIITENLEFLAKISIIEDEWPDFYQKILHNESILEEAENYFRGNSGQSSQIKKCFDENKNKGLKEFLNANRLVRVEDIRPFLMLNQASYEVTSPDATTVKNCISQNDAKELSQVLEKTENENEKINYIKIILEKLEDSYKNERHEIRFNCLNIITEIYEQIPSQIKAEVLSNFAIHINTSGIIKQLDEFKPANLFRIIKDLENDYKNFVLSKYIEFAIRNDTVNEEILAQFIQNYEIVPSEARDNLSNILIGRLNKDSNDEIALKIIESIADSNAKEKLLNQEIVRKLIDRIERENNSPEQKGADLYLKIKDIADTKNKEHFIRKQFEMVATQNVSNAPAINSYIIETLSKLDDADVPSSIADEMYSEFIKLTSQFEINQKIQHYLPILKHFTKLSQDNQNDYITQHLDLLFSRGNTDIIIQALNQASEYNVPVFEYGHILQKLQQRIKSDLKDSNLVASLIKNTPQSKLDEVKDFVIELITHSDAALSRIGAEGFAGAYGSFQENQVNDICNECLNVAQERPIEQKNSFLNPVSKAFEKCSLDVKGRFIDHVLLLLTHDDARWQGEGKRLYEEIAPHLTDDLKARIASQTINKLHGIQDDQLPNANILFDVIISLEEEAQRDDWLIFLNILSKMISDAQPGNIRVLGLQYLERISKLYHRSDDILNQISLAAKSGDSQIAEQAKRTLMVFKDRLKNHEE